VNRVADGQNSGDTPSKSTCVAKHPFRCAALDYLLHIAMIFFEHFALVGPIFVSGHSNILGSK